MGEIEFLIRPRQSGKTTDMLMWLNSRPMHVLVVHSRSERDRLLKWIADRQMSIESDQIVTLDEALNGRLRGRSGNCVVGIDNLDIILYYLFGSVERVTSTGILADRV